MSADTPARLALLRELRDEILLHYGTGRPAVAIDGLVGSGADRLADDLAEAFAERGHAVARASLSAFLRADSSLPHDSVFHVGGEHDDGYAGRYDTDAFRDTLVTPFRRGDAEVAVLPAGVDAIDPDAVLLVDGTFLLQPSLAGLWSYAVFVEVPREIAAERAVGVEDAPSDDAQRHYLAEVRPRTRAVAIVDNTDLAAPVRRFADSC